MAGNDQVHGGDGDDYVRGEAGDDLFDGGSGFDRAGFFFSPVGVTVSLLLQGVAQNTGEGLDTLVDIENLSGGPLDDTLIGDNGANWLWGEAGNNFLSGNGGNDLLMADPQGTNVMTGGAGIDTASMAFGPVNTLGVTLSLALQGSFQNNGQGLTKLSGIENLSGTLNADNLTGDDGDNVLAGDAGDDRLSGGKGNDVLYGDGIVTVDEHEIGGGPIETFEDGGISFGTADGSDLLDGGNGDDLLFGAGGDDVLTGGKGRDGFVFGANSGHDVITDFESKDMIRFQAASGVDDFGDLTFTKIGHDTLIGWGTGDWILVEDVKPGQLNPSDFTFG
jgi:Ca2+-binding RTX toxin-like protein